MMSGVISSTDSGKNSHSIFGSPSSSASGPRPNDGSPFWARMSRDSPTRKLMRPPWRCAPSPRGGASALGAALRRSSSFPFDLPDHPPQRGFEQAGVGAAGDHRVAHLLRARDP